MKSFLRLIRIKILLLAICAWLAATFASGAGEQPALRMGPNTRAIMLNLLATGPDEDRCRAAMALGAAKVGDAETVKALAAQVAHKSPPVRAAVMFALGCANNPEALAALRQGAADPQWMVQVEALRSLAAYPPSAESANAALAALASTDSSVRLAALQCLAKVAMPESEAKLAAFIKDEKKPQLQAAALDAIALRLPKAAATIAPSLDSTDSQVKAAALRAVAASGQASLKAKVAPLAKDRVPEVRREALAAAAALGCDNYDALIAAGCADADYTVRLAAAEALAKLPAEKSAEMLAALQQDEYRDVRRAASEALLAQAAGGKRGAVGVEALKKMAVGDAGSTSRERRIEALFIAGKLKDAAILPEISSAIEPYVSKREKPSAKAAPSKNKPKEGEENAEEPKIFEGEAKAGVGAPEARLFAWAIGQCKAKEFGARAVEAFQDEDQAVRLQGAVAVGLIPYAPAVPAIDKTLSETVQTEMGPVYRYGGQARVELVRAFGLIGTPESLDAFIKRVNPPVPEGGDILAEVCKVILDNKLAKAEKPLRDLYVGKQTSDDMKNLIRATLNTLLGADCGLQEIKIPKAYDTFFITAREN